MKSPELFIIARALHILTVVVWIGGVAFVTTVLLPAIKRQSSEALRYELFEQLEGRFAFQAKVTTLLAGISGFYMLYFLNAWSRYAQPEYWWLHAMTLIWLIFTLILFVFEPLFLHSWFAKHAKKNSKKTFKVLQIMHIVLLTLSVITVLGATMGSHGYQF